MDDANRRAMPPGGGVGGGAGAVLDRGDWRAQLPPEARERIVNKILEYLLRHHPVSNREGLQELNKIALRFEGTFYAAATCQSDYIWKISLKIWTMETKSQSTRPYALPSNPAGNSCEDSGKGKILNTPPSMASINNGLCHQKRARLPPSNQNENQNPVDYISQLPNDIIAHIFSFLTTKDAVKTSVLSKQWRSTWTSNQYMSFSLPPGSSWNPKSFIAFVDSVLLRCTAIQVKARADLVKGLLKRLHHVMKLVMGSWCLQALSLMGARDMFLPSLKCRHLILLGAAGHEGVPEAIAKILESTRLLEKLFIQTTCTPNSAIGLKAERAGCRVFAGEEFWNLVKWRIYQCLMHLRHVEIVDGGASLLAWEPVLSLLKFLLQNALWLDKIVINSTNSKSSQAFEPSPQLEVGRILLSHPKCSPSAKVILRYPFQGCPSV
ncbi:uncharacterized protein LOC104445337 isoform X6 [Eucalyptus grandis]|uniref:uncharacterized protein LOC104445337 isoform X6 n=1 Tax=Eucalyptus grandis TaxID=71139 RepID=UPI00192EBE8D|nr:uncharacterized protein LOC104445337 isoform X6 [Eucalyptus grandis]